MKKLIPQKIKNAYHLLQAILANVWHRFPSRKIKVIGVTGTNGKTTTCQMIAKILEEAGYKTAMISTINFKLDSEEWVNNTKFTTLSSFATQKFIKRAVEKKCDYLVLETSSHSLDQNRVWGVKYDAAVITNLTREHLDYHETMDKYRKAKMKLFQMTSKNNGTLIVNLNMENPRDFLKYEAKEKYGYAARIPVSRSFSLVKNEARMVAAGEIEMGINHSKFKIQNSKFLLNLPGEFNIENALAAISAGLSQNIGMQTIASALSKIKGVPGRLEYVPNGRNLKIIVDYAVTPDSLEKLYELISSLKLARKQPGRLTPRVIVVFGACGERDRGKRPIMGEIVSRYADYIVLTNEDPYREDPEKIINEVAAGVKNKQLDVNFWKILDRRGAIKKALRIAKTGDFVVVTGKGAEVTMAIGGKRIPWNDKKVILEELG